MNNNIFIKQQGKALVKFEAHKPPLFEDVKNSEFVQYGYVARGDKEAKKWNNLYPDYLLYLYNRSAKNNSIINAKNKYIVGQGWSFNNTGLTFQQRTNLKAFSRSLEKSKITRDLSLDRTIFGGFACEIITSNDSSKITPSHIDFSKVRQFKITTDKEGNKSDLKYGYTSDWSVKNPEDNEDFETLYPFTWDENDIDSNKRYIVYYKDYRPDSKEYPLPDYIGAVPYIESDYEISNFVLNNVKNGFSGGYLVQFNNGTPTDEDKADIDRRFDNAFTGTDNAGSVLKSFNEDKESGIEITPLNANGQDDRYINLNKQIQGEIFTGHNFNPAISGITDGNGFNNNAGEIRVASEMFQNTYVDTEQGVLEDFFNSVAGYNGLPEKLTIIKLEVVSEPLSEATIVQISTIDELRDRAGMSPSLVESNKVSEALSTLSPLVATKILETMSAKEVRDLIGLKTTSAGVQTSVQLSSQEIDTAITEHFSSCGINDEDYDVIDFRELKASDMNDAFYQGEKFKREYFISKEESLILGLLNKGETPSAISTATGISQTDLAEFIDNLVEQGLINEDGELTPKGKTETEQNEVFVVYKYALRGDAPKLEGGSSRPFCSSLMRQSQFKSWTREDINALNNNQGLDVFSSRGGFYNNPKTGVTTPFCRHVWQQRLVRLK
jgi:hypothetical protein